MNAFYPTRPTGQATGSASDASESASAPALTLGEEIRLAKPFMPQVAWRSLLLALVLTISQVSIITLTLISEVEIA